MATESTSDVIRQASRLLGQAAELLTSVPNASGTNERPVASSSRNNSRKSDGLSRRQTNRKVKKIVCVLSSRNCSRAPTPQERTTLKANGLGEKTLFFSSFGSAADVKSVLLREFPRLEEGGGFEIMRTMDNSRTYLSVASVGACTVDELMQMTCGRIYIRPIQRSLPIDETKKTLVSSDYEECHHCGSLINLENLRDHSKECQIELNLKTRFICSTPVDQETSDGQHAETSESGSVNSFAVEEILEKLKDIHDPVLILKEYQKIFLLGRKLDLTSESEVLEGKTTSIFVSRDRILETGFTELLELDLDGLDVRLPLDVTFYGEEAEDSGGPRKEFFSLMLKEFIKEENHLFQDDEDGEDQYCFIENDKNLDKNWYYAAGLVCGLSIVQSGPLPTFIKNFGHILENPTSSQDQFLKGLNKVGFVDLIKAKPCIRFLFQATAKADITLRKLKHLLQPKLDEAGSNKRKRQEKIYEIFLNYLKEVAAGRREVQDGKITLGHILKFITGSEWEPVLGYSLQPKICFTEAEDTSLIPKSSTCINCLYLPVPGVLDPMPEPSHLFKFYDLAFCTCNTYFGLN